MLKSKRRLKQEMWLATINLSKPKYTAKRETSGKERKIKSLIYIREMKTIVINRIVTYENQHKEKHAERG